MGTFLLFPFLHFPTTSLKCESKRDLHVPTLKSQVGGKMKRLPNLTWEGQRKTRVQSLVFDPTLDWLWSRFQLFLRLKGLGSTSRSLCAPSDGYEPGSNDRILS